MLRTPRAQKEKIRDDKRYRKGLAETLSCIHGAPQNLAEVSAKYFASEDVSVALPGIPWDDVREALAELRDDGYIDLYMMGACDLFPKAIEYGETAVERGIDKALDVWSKLH